MSNVPVATARHANSLGPFSSRCIFDRHVGDMMVLPDRSLRSETVRQLLSISVPRLNGGVTGIPSSYAGL